MATKKLNNESANVVTNNELTEEQKMQQFVTENIALVPKVMKNRFEKLDAKTQFIRMQHYVEVQKLKEEFASLTKIAWKVKQLFDQKKANREDAISVMEFCKRFIDTCKERELAEVNEEIARLTELKSKLEKED